MAQDLTDWAELDFGNTEIQAGSIATELLDGYNAQSYGMYDWCYDSQQLMGLLSEDTMF